MAFPAGIHSDDWDIWCDLILVDEGGRSGYLGVSWGLGGGNGIGAPPLVSFGTPAQQRQFLVPVLSGEKRICLGITEASGGSDVASLRTTAKKTGDGRHYLVNGSKKVRPSPALYSAASDGPSVVDYQWNRL